jgi:hypothetical protein
LTIQRYHGNDEHTQHTERNKIDKVRRRPSPLSRHSREGRGNRFVKKMLVLNGDFPGRTTVILAREAFGV